MKSIVTILTPYAKLAKQSFVVREINLEYKPSAGIYLTGPEAITLLLAAGVDLSKYKGYKDGQGKHAGRIINELIEDEIKASFGLPVKRGIALVQQDPINSIGILQFIKKNGLQTHFGKPTNPVYLFDLITICNLATTGNTELILKHEVFDYTRPYVLEEEKQNTSKRLNLGTSTGRVSCTQPNESAKPYQRTIDDALTDMKLTKRQVRGGDIKEFFDIFRENKTLTMNIVKSILTSGSVYESFIETIEEIHHAFNSWKANKDDLAKAKTYVKFRLKYCIDED